MAVPTIAAQERGVGNKPCPSGAIAVEPGASIQDAVEHAGNGAVFCLKNGTHRVQVIRPKQGQSFHGEGQTVLNGSRLLTTFSREALYWVAGGQRQHGQRHGQCAKDAPTCSLPEVLFIDDKPLVQVLSKDRVVAGQFFLDRESGFLYFADDPTGRKVEVTVAAFAFESSASSVLIRNMTIEKYASVAQKGAIQSGGVASGWTVENCVVRLNSGAGIGVGSSARLRANDIHHNGQIGITGVGREVLIENNRVWENNVRGFDTQWEAGGVKMAASDVVVFRGNHVHNNIGAGLWCDIDCRNVVYEANLVEQNRGPGIFHEISFNAVVRYNVMRHNGIRSSWFWGAGILIAASQDVDVYANTVIVSGNGCGIVLVDQNRSIKSGGKYKTRNNTIHHNELTFDNAVCAGGVSDAAPGDENFAIITDGNNVFDRNVYRVPRASGPMRFAWGHAILDWDGLHTMGLERAGTLLVGTD